MSAPPPGSRAKIIQDLAVDVTAIKKELVEQNNKVEHIALWIKDNWKPVLDNIKDKFGSEVEKLRDDIDSTSKFGKNMANWIKDNLGSKLEKLNEIISVEVDKQITQKERKSKEDQKVGT
jgi:hypothetical protein